MTPVVTAKEQFEALLAGKALKRPILGEEFIYLDEYGELMMNDGTEVRLFDGRPYTGYTDVVAFDRPAATDEEIVAELRRLADSEALHPLRRDAFRVAAEMLENRRIP